jgi:hypothetical protein
MMTPLKKKHFEAIATVIRTHAMLRAVGMPTSLPEVMADYLATTSPTFNREKFLALCHS